MSLDRKELEIQTNLENTESGLDRKFKEALSTLEKCEKEVIFEFNSVPFTITKDFNREEEINYYQWAINLDSVCSKYRTQIKGVEYRPLSFSTIIKEGNFDRVQKLKELLSTLNKEPNQYVFLNEDIKSFDKLENNFRNLFKNLIKKENGTEQNKKHRNKEKNN